MKNILAVICEYNPFHNGHKYQLDTHRRELNSSGVVCIMSGSFTQRGKPAVLNKWVRAEMAVKNGADLVLELPTCFSSQSAERFSRGAVSLADSLKIIDYLSFGSESGDVEKLEKAADFLIKSEENGEIMKYYKEGLSYPQARQRMIDDSLDDEISEIIKTPNNILGVEYIMALKKQKSAIRPKTLKRLGASHDAREIKDNISSASNLREMIKNGEDISLFVPPDTNEIIKREKKNLVCDFSALSGILTYILRTKTSEELKNILDMAEGLENRFIEAARRHSDISEIIEYVKTKRYTKTRIERIITNIILGITKDMEFKKCEYIRVLALNSRGAELLNEIKEKSSLPIITKTAGVKLTGDAKKMFELDLLATDIYALLTNNKTSGQDFTNSPVFV